MKCRTESVYIFAARNRADRGPLTGGWLLASRSVADAGTTTKSSAKVMSPSPEVGSEIGPFRIVVRAAR